LSESADLYAYSPEAVREPPTTLRGTLSQIGPGIILAGSIVGTGELIATTNLGAKAGFTFLWLVIVSCFIKVFVQIELGRQAMSTGQTSLKLFAGLPSVGKLLPHFWIFVVLVTQTQIAAMIGGVGQALHLAMPSLSEWTSRVLAQVSPALSAAVTNQPELPWAAVTTLVSIVLLLGGKYHRIQKISLVLVGSFTAMTIVCVGVLPMTEYGFSLGEVLGGLTFTIPAAAVASAFAMFGITGVGAAELVAYPYWCIEQGYARSAGAPNDDDAWSRRARGWIRVMEVDAWLSMAVYTISTLGFYVLGASVLHRQGLEPQGTQMVATLAEMYAPVFGASSLYVMSGGAVVVLFSTLYIGTAGNSRMITDFLHIAGWISLITAKSRQRWVSLMCTLLLLIGFVMFVAVGQPRNLVLIGGSFQAISLPAIAGATLYLRYKRRSVRLDRSGFSDACLWIAMIGMTLVSGYGLWDRLRGLLEG
jgi:Mn2+/Fe2+ NRAMP family transporter